MDDGSGSLSSLLVFILLLLGNIIITLAHNALVNARKGELEAKAESGQRSAALALELSQDATRLLITYQLSVTILHFLQAGTAMLGLAPWLVNVFPGLSPLVAQGGILLLVAVVVEVIGEQVPETYATAHADRLALALARPIKLLVRLLMPLSWLLRRISRVLLRLLAVEGAVHLVTEEEIKTLVDAGQEEGVLQTQEKDMIFSIIALDETAVREVMVPRLDIVALALQTPLDEAVEIIIKAGHSRIPVYDENIDHIVGLLYAKDLLRLWNKGGNGNAMRSLLRKAYFVPEGKSAMTLLGEMQRDRYHMAVVVDEYGGTAGVVTLEDLIEEITGEIKDEYDINERDAYRQVSEDEYICSARLDLDDLNRLLDLDLPTDENDTLGGLIFSQVGEVPTPGMVIDIPAGRPVVRLEVLTVDGRRIENVRVTRLRPEQTVPGEAQETPEHAPLEG